MAEDNAKTVSKKATLDAKSASMMLGKPNMRATASRKGRKILAKRTTESTIKIATRDGTSIKSSVISNLLKKRICAIANTTGARMKLKAGHVWVQQERRHWNADRIRSTKTKEWGIAMMKAKKRGQSATKEAQMVRNSALAWTPADVMTLKNTIAGVTSRRASPREQQKKLSKPAGAASMTSTTNARGILHSHTPAPT